MTVNILNREQRQVLERHLTPELVGSLQGAASLRCFGTMESDELLQDTLTRIARSIDTYQDRGNFRGWAMTVLYSTWKNTIAARARGFDTVPMPDSMHEGWDGDVADPVLVEDEVLSRGYSPEISSVIAQLSGMQRDALILNSDGFSYQEIADRMGVSVGSVKSALHKGRRKASKILRLGGEL